MNEEDLQDAIEEALTNHIPFILPDGVEFTEVIRIVDNVAAEMGYVRDLPHAFKDHSFAFHLSPDKGLRWGYVRNREKVGWYEGRETTPLPERDVVIKDSDPVYAAADELLNA